VYVGEAVCERDRVCLHVFVCVCKCMMDEYMCERACMNCESVYLQKGLLFDLRWKNKSVVGRESTFALDVLPSRIRNRTSRNAT